MALFVFQFMLLRTLISKQPVYQYYVELRWERAFSESYMAESFVGVTKFARGILKTALWYFL